MGRVTKYYHSMQNEDIVLTVEQTNDKINVNILKPDGNTQVTLDEGQIIDLMYDLQDCISTPLI